MDEDQIIVNVSDLIPPDNLGTVDKNNKVGNVYTKDQFDTKIQGVKEMIGSSIVGVLRISEAKPTIKGKYELSEIGTYANIIPIIALGESVPTNTPITTVTGYLNSVYFDGVNFTQLRADVNVIADGSITQQKTSFAKNESIPSGKNIIDPGKKKAGHYIDWDTGIALVNAAYDAYEDNIVDPDQPYYFPAVFHIAWKRPDGSLISGETFSGPGNTSRVSPPNAAYLSISVLSGATVQVEKGTVPTTYEPFSGINLTKIDNLYIPRERTLPNIIAPAVMHWAEGQQLNMYFDNIFIEDGIDFKQYMKTCVSLRGQYRENFYRYTPQSFDSVVHVKLAAHDSKESILKIVEVRVAPLGNGAGDTIKAMGLGDSTVNNTATLQAVRDKLAEGTMTVNWIGTRNTGGISHEGRPGWTIADYTTSNSNTPQNPFWNGAFDFSHYMATTGQALAIGDWVFIQLGINDLYRASIEDGSDFPNDIDVELMMTRLKMMIDSIKAYNADVKIGIVGTFPPYINQEATGVINGGSNGSINSMERYVKKGLLPWWKLLLSEFDNDTARAAGKYFIPANIAIDRRTSFNSTTEPINSHNTNQVTVYTDDVHPNVAGYKQIADAYIGVIKYFA